MNQLIPTQQNRDGNILVSGRDLHDFLEIGTQYTKWFDRMTDYGFVPDVDYVTVIQKRLTAQGNETTYNDHHIKIPMAKEISMLQRNEKGKQARLYFLDLEEKWNSPEMVIKRAHEYLESQVAQLETKNLVLEQQVQEMKPKADYTDTILRNKGLVTISQISKDYGMTAQEMNKLLHELRIQFKQSGQWLLYREVHDRGYTHSETIDYIKKDGTPGINMITKWTQKGRLFLYERLKEEGILPLIEKDDET